MKLKGIKYISPLFDSSGYAQASRSYVMALYKAGIPLTLAPVAFEQASPKLKDEERRVFDYLLHRDIDYNVVIVHLTPEFWPNHMEHDKFNVGYTVWETTRLHPAWSGHMNHADLILGPCQWNKDVFISSGVTKPIGIIPHISIASDYDGVKAFPVSGVKEGAFKFYSIFQFTERKHPLALVKSYWAAFPNGENVALIIKTYSGAFNEESKNSVKTAIQSIKRVMPMDNHPPIYLILDMLSRDQILGLHTYGDCFVSLDRGEGFGLCGFEAGAAGKPVIETGFGGALEYVKLEHSYPVNYTLTPVFGMPWSPWYRGDQMWAEPDCEHAIKQMQHVFENQEEAKLRGIALRQFIRDNFNEKIIGDKIINVIEEHL